MVLLTHFLSCSCLIRFLPPSNEKAHRFQSVRLNKKGRFAYCKTAFFSLPSLFHQRSLQKSTVRINTLIIILIATIIFPRFKNGQKNRSPRFLPVASVDMTVAVNCYPSFSGLASFLRRGPPAPQDNTIILQVPNFFFKPLFLAYVKILKSGTVLRVTD